MELQTKLLEQKTFNTGPQTEEHMLKVIDKSGHKEHLYQPIQFNNKHFDIAVTLLTVYNGIFNVTNKKEKFYFTVSINEDNFTQITFPPGK